MVSTTRATIVAGVFAVAALLAAPDVAIAQADTAQARQVVADVNGKLGSLTKTAFSAKRPDVEYKSEGKAWSEAGAVLKLEITDRDDSGDVVTEYYYANGSLVFAYVAIKGFNDAGKQVTRGEERQYFRGDKMFKWLSGMDKAEIPAAGAEFAEESRTRLAASAVYVKAARQAIGR